MERPAPIIASTSAIEPPSVLLGVVRAASAALAPFLLAAGLVTGCASKEQQPGYDPVASGDTLVISGTPRTDTAAFRRSDRTLLQAEFGVIEERGPTPRWGSIDGHGTGGPIGPSRTDRREHREQAAERNQQFDDELRASSSAGGAPRGPIRENSPAQLDNGWHAPMVLPDEPADQDADANAAVDEGDVGDPQGSFSPLGGESERPRRLRPDGQNPRNLELPVTRTELGNDRVRLIWHLQSFGGPRVQSKRDGGTTRRDISLSPAELAPLVEIIKDTAGEGTQVLPLPNENKVVITCPVDVEPALIALLAELDVPAPQVEITAKIFEVNHDFDYQQGAQLLLNRIAQDNTQTALTTFQTERLRESIAQDAPFQGSIITLLKAFENAGVNVEASFELLAETGLIHVVSSPRLMVAEGQTGYMLAGQELPIQATEIHNNALRTSTQYKPVGVQLYITPQAIGDGHVKLHTVSIVSSVAGFTPLPTIRGANSTPLFFNPIIESREAETAVTIPDGDTLVISGMRMVRTTTREDKVPWLGDLPLIGNFFKSHRSQQRMTDLYFFVTPTLVSALD